MAIPRSYLVVAAAAIFVAVLLATPFAVGFLAGQAFTRAAAESAGAGHYTADGRDWRWGVKP